MAPSAVNNGARALEGIIARHFFDNDMSVEATLSGSVIQMTANRASLTLTGTTSNYVANFMQGFTMGANPNTGPVSVNVDSVGPISLRDNRGTSLSSSVILAGTRVLIVKDATNDYFRLLYPHYETAGLWELIATATASSSSSVDFTWAGKTYKKVIIPISAALPASDAVEAWLRTSTDGGSGYDAGASDYEWALQTLEVDATATAATLGDDADAQINMTSTSAGRVGNAANEGWSGIVEITFPAETEYTTLNFRGMYTVAAGVGRTVVGSGRRLSAADVDGVRFLFESGNIASGEFAAYGLL